MDAEFVDGFTSKAKATATSKGSRRDLDAEDGINVTSDEADLNERALSVISRVNKKLTGRDFETDEDAIRRQALSVKEQVHKLIQQATSHENLAVLYQGWCSFW
jgi:FKBP12-rapamycin complex-associated protein